MYFRLAKRALLETDKRLLWKAIWNFGFKGMRAVQKHRARLRRGVFFPPFLYISIVNSCNLRCQGCWVDVAAKQSRIEVDAMDRLIRESKAMGNSFFGTLTATFKFSPTATSSRMRWPASCGPSAT